ncbi:MAG TPA: T9SS type A sorting domain-containing protein, partial [bacterium]|nr:T9SS type A sorting domain-containing protein [bacterium]
TVSVLKDGIHKAGKHSITWNAIGMPSGIYFYTLKADGFTETKKILLLK